MIISTKRYTKKKKKWKIDQNANQLPFNEKSKIAFTLDLFRCISSIYNCNTFVIEYTMAMFQIGHNNRNECQFRSILGVFFREHNGANGVCEVYFTCDCLYLRSFCFGRFFGFMLIGHI